ncbi:MAG: ferredoxin--NADP reductase [Cyclobacteriaceae bacterium]|nr:ferredoxin--NADP reductase [Cyclobacteriaceae bacterium HetDA_MAG_MS6]
MAFGLFKKKKKETKADSRYHQLTIREVVPVAKDAVNLIFESPESDFQYQAGQFITIITEVNGKKIRRAYSLCSAPDLDEYPAVTVKRVTDGLMSNHINDHFEAGQVIEVMEPMGMFTTENDPSRVRHAVFFGGGSGITPLYSLIRTILHHEPQSNLALVYGNRSQEYIVFKEELMQLEKQYRGRFQVKHILETDTNSLASFVGRPTPDMIGEMLSSLHTTADTEYYICGPQPMMDVIAEGLDQAKVSEDQIRMESFEAGKTSPSEIIAEDSSSGGSEVTVILEGESYSITVEKGRAILETGLEDDLDMPYSCQSGLCTACRGKCLEGEVSIDEAEGLSQDELDDGYVLTCVGKPLTDKVKIEIG